MLPEIGATELLVIAAVALIVVGPKDLPMLLRKLGGFVARLRGMASEFRTSFDEMARQSELDDLRREVAAMRDAATAESHAVDTHLGEISHSIHNPAPLDPAMAVAGEPGTPEYDPEAYLRYDEPPSILDRKARVAKAEAADGAKPAKSAAKAAKPKTTVSKVAAPKAPAVKTSKPKAAAPKAAVSKPAAAKAKPRAAKKSAP